jgi:type IV secretion system protein VirB6
MYNAVIVSGFFDAPRALAAVIVGAYDPVGIVDRIAFAGDDVARMLFRRSDIWTPSYALAGIVVALIMGFVAVYTIFLLSLSRIALSILLAIGPLFIASLMFETTKRFFEAWLAQLVHYAMIAVLTVLVAALMMTLVETAAQSAVAAGDGIQIAHATRMCMAAGLALLVMRQVNAMASGLAGGIALATGGVVSGLTSWALGRSLRGVGQFARGTWRAALGQRRNSLRRA